MQIRSFFVPQDPLLASLRRSWWLIALVAGLLLWLGFYVLRATWLPSSARRWTLLAGGILAYELAFLWRGLEHNHRRDEAALLGTLGAGNTLTLARGLALGLLAGFLFSPWPPGGLAWVPTLLYTLAIIADYLDGYLARITRHSTLLGEKLDIEFDALGILIATSLAVHYRQLPWWYLLLGLSRYLFLFGMWWRKRQAKPVYNLPASNHRRTVAGFQMSILSVMLWPVLYPPATTLAGVASAIPFTASFIRDWLVVSGRLDPNSRPYLEARRKMSIMAVHWLPVVLRMSVVLTMAPLILTALASAPARIAFFAWPGMPFPQLATTAIIVIALPSVVMLTLGAAGRLAALGLLIASSANILVEELHLSNGFWLVSTIFLMLLGSGALSCWRPEDDFLSRRAGQNGIG
jgi:CDP-diacylglycerol--glycerol-3-phosphate 3-phosphatidyltransferase